jgi:uncharacterized protein YjbI with pentapeptide repeats
MPPDYSGQNLRGRSFRNQNLTGANFSSADIQGADFSGTNLSMANLSGADLSKANLSGADLSEANLIGANLTSAFLVRADLTGADLIRADLTEAYFTEAKLPGADLIRADLTGVDLSRTKLWEIDLTGANLTGADLTGADLSGANLIGANLSTARLTQAYLGRTNFTQAYLIDANLTGANLSGANLSRANLSGACLIRTQALGTNLTGANFTGACLEDWSINSATNLTDVICDYIYRREGQKERRPSSGRFAPGEFTKLYEKVQETVDLIFTDGIDWKAFLLSFQELRNKYGDENLSVQAIEKKSGGAFVIRLEVPPEANKAEIERQAKELYELKLNLVEETYRTQLQARDREIAIYLQHNASLENIISTLATRLIQIDVSAKAESQSMSEAPKKQSNFNLQGAQFGGGLVNADTVSAHQIGGDITNYNQVARTEANNSPVKTILILAANPKNTSPLRLGEEVREIDAGLQRAKKRELFDLKQRWAVRVQEVYQSLLDFKPQIVHFSGHGSGDDGLALEDETGNVRLVDTVALANLFELFASNVECVVLNACYSEVQANAIVKHIPYVIGMNKQIGDKAAIKFATGFYNAVGAGESVEFAYKLGCSVIQLEGIPEHLTPVLKKK